MDDGDTTIAICIENCDGGSFEDIYKRARDMEGVIGETVLARLAESVNINININISYINIFT